MTAQQFREGDLVSIEGVIRTVEADHLQVKIPGMPGRAFVRPSEVKLVAPVLKHGDRVLVDTGGAMDVRGTVIAAIPGFAWVELVGDPIPRSVFAAKIRRVEIVEPVAAEPAPFRYVEAEEGEA